MTVFMANTIRKFIKLWCHYSPVGIPRLLLPRPKPFTTFPRTKRGRSLVFISEGMNK